MRRELDAALQQIAELEAHVHERRPQLDRNASKSSIPPSANPPGAPRLVVEARSHHKRCGQPGHPDSFRRCLPPERVIAIVDHVPESRAACHAPLPEEPAPGDPEPTWHRLAEIPEPAVIVTEHRGHARACPSCGKVTRAASGGPIAAHVIGPPLAALMSYLAGHHHLSRRGAQEFVEDALSVLPISLGTVGALERQAAAALAAVHDEAAEAVRTAPARNVDETGWKQAGQRRWLWAAATATVACFVIHARRNWEWLKVLLGAATTRVVGRDRWGTYNRLPPEQRQGCWAHLDHDFCRYVDYRARRKRSVEPARRRRRGCLRRGGTSTSERSTGSDSGWCWTPSLARSARRWSGVGAAPTRKRRLSARTCWRYLYPALWLFAACEGVEPTNNHADRIVRGVRWRKNPFGSQGQGGCWFAEWMLTEVRTLRLQHRSVLANLERAITAHRRGEPAPKLVGS